METNQNQSKSRSRFIVDDVLLKDGNELKSMKSMFEVICREEGITMSDKIRQFIRGEIKKNQK